MFYSTYDAACNEARDRSLLPMNVDCGIHVAAVLRHKLDDTPYIAEYCHADWIDSAVVASYVNGERK